MALPEQKLQELMHMLSTPTTQCLIVWKELEILVGKIRSMHLAVTGAVGQLYHIQRALV